MQGHSLGPLQELHLGTVLDNADPDSRGRLRLRLHSTGMELWAAVMVPSAGSGYGVSLLPRIGEQVVVGFVGPDLPLVLGAVWSGAASQPGEAAPVDDRYYLRTPGGIEVLMDDTAPSVRITTPAGHHLTIDDSGGGSVTIEKGAEKIEMSSSGISITSSAQVKVEASQVSVSAGMVKVDAGMSKFSGVVQCDTLISNSVVSASYTPGAGNIW
ncbi:MAG: VgrG protein [Zoogloea sp.]|nr:VgrG protein [Zoogloea sp.]